MRVGEWESGRTSRAELSHSPFHALSHSHGGSRLTRRITMSERPVLVGHRGGAGTREIENTVPAFRDGYEHGLRHMEVDVRLTLDDRVVVFHDPTLGRATDGGDGRLLSQVTLDA